MPVQTRSMLKKQSELQVPTYDETPTESEINFKSDFCRDIKRMLNKMAKCGHKLTNKKIECYLEICKYNVANIRNSYIMNPQQLRRYVKAVWSKCIEFNKSLEEKQYDKLSYGLIVECHKINLILESICVQLYNLDLINN
jgi:hypothetical protein